MARQLPAALVAAGALFSAAVYSRLPDRFPVHWSPGGVPDGYAERWWGAFVIPALMLLVSSLRSRPKGEVADVEQDEAYGLMLGGVLGFLLVGHVCVLGSALGWRIAVLPVILAAAGVMMVLCGIAMRRVGPNRVLGIRTRATLSSRRVWDETHRVASTLFVASGCATVLAAALVPAIALWVAAGASLAAALGSSVWASVVARRQG